MKGFRELLFELFDRPWTKTLNRDHTEFYKKDIENHYKGYKITNDNSYDLEDDNGHLLSFMRDGILEAHHISKNGESGKMLSSKKSNPRFLSTMIHHLKTEGLDKGRSIRVHVIDETQARHYRTIINKKFGNYDVHHTHEHINGTTFFVSKISPRGNPIIESSFERCMK